MKDDFWKGKKFSFYSHRECESFPCHSTKDIEGFNCLFCYCPLYVLGDKCGGNYIYIDDIKDCSHCLLPHKRGSYGYIVRKYDEIKKFASRHHESIKAHEEMKIAHAKSGVARK